MLCEKVLGRPDLITDERFATNPDRVAHDDELTPVIEAVLAGLTPDEVVTRLDEAGITRVPGHAQRLRMVTSLQAAERRSCGAWLRRGGQMPVPCRHERGRGMAPDLG